MNNPYSKPTWIRVISIRGKMQGYIKLHRQILENPLFDIKPYSKGQAWIAILLLTNHKKGFITCKNGQIITVDRGECGYSEVALADIFGWSRGKVKRFIELLIEQKMIQQKIECNHSIIKVLNYKNFQNDTINDTINSTTNDTINDTINSTQTKNDNNDNNDNNENKENFQKFWALCPKQTDEYKSFGVYVNIIADGIATYEEIENGMRAYSEYVKNNEIKPQYITSPINWLSGQKWKDNWNIKDYSKMSILEKIGRA